MQSAIKRAFGRQSALGCGGGSYLKAWLRQRFLKGQDNCGNKQSSTCRRLILLYFCGQRQVVGVPELRRSNYYNVLIGKLLKNHFHCWF